MAYSDEFKAQVITAVVSGTPVNRVALAHGVARGTIHNWLAALPEYPGNDRMMAYLWRAFSEGGGISREQMRAGTLLERMLKHDGSDYPDTDALDDLVGE